MVIIEESEKYVDHLLGNYYLKRDQEKKLSRKDLSKDKS